MLFFGLKVGSVQLLALTACTLRLLSYIGPVGSAYAPTGASNFLKHTLQYSPQHGMRAREAAAARGRDAAAAAAAIHAENLQELQTLRTPEELAADAAADLHDMITGASAICK